LFKFFVKRLADPAIFLAQLKINPPAGHNLGLTLSKRGMASSAILRFISALFG
jgi:hypothetical protein